MAAAQPFIVGVGGTTRAGSSTEKALMSALAAARELGAETDAFVGPELMLPPYAPEDPGRTEAAVRLVAALRRADGVILASPGYHGGMSGLIKNALDYAEDLSGDDPPYLDGRAVGVIVAAGGWQATATALQSLRNVVHALRGWPTPLGVAINTAEPAFDAEGAPLDPKVRAQLRLVAEQVVGFAERRAAR